MELREYGRILWRRWWIPVLLTLIVTGLSAIQLRPWETKPPTEYIAQMRLLIGVIPLPNADTSIYDPRYFAWLTSEYLVDDFTEVVASQLFAENVSNRLNLEGLAIPAGAIQGSATTGKQHRIITLELLWPDKDQATAIANAAVTELKENAEQYFSQLGTDNTAIEVLDWPLVEPVPPTARERLEFPLRVLLAFLAGIGLAFLVDYMDDSVRNRNDLDALGVSIIGAIPRHK